MARRVLWSAAIAALLVAILLVANFRLNGPSPLAANAAPAEFSARRAVDIFRATFGGQSAHPVASPRNATIANLLRNQLIALGYRVETESRFVCDAAAFCAPVVNLIALPPDADGHKPIVLGVAHYDSVPAGPGASDDGINAAGLVAVARAVRGEHHHHPIAFLIDDGEEAGLLGAEAFVADTELRQRIGDVAAVVNVEARGTSGPSFLFETGHGSESFIAAVTRAMKRPVTSSLFATIYDLLPNDTDLTVFKRVGITGVNFAFAGDVGNYHTTRDDLAHIDLRSVQHEGDNALAALRALADDVGASPRAGGAVWFDVLGFAVVSWPAAAAPWIAAVCLIVALFAAAREGLAHALWGAAFFIATLGATVLIASILRPVVRGSANWLAWPQPGLVAMWIVGVATALGMAAFFSAPNLRAGTAVMWAMIALGVSVTLPGASYIFTIPAALLALLALIGGPAGDVTSAIIVGAAAAILWFPLILFLYPMLGATSLTFVAVLVALVTTTVAPARLLMPRAVLISAAVVLMVCLLAALLLPSYTADHPQRLNITFFDDGTSPKWLASAMSPELRATANFEREPRGFGAGIASPSRSFAASAPRLPIPPVLVWREGTVVHVLSQRRSDRIALTIHAPLRAFRVNGILPAPRNGRARSYVAPGWTRVVCRGSEMTVDTGTLAPLEVFASDTTFGLPPAAISLAAARNRSNAVPSDDGDTTVTLRHERM